MKDEEFEALIEKAIDELPREFFDKLVNVSVVVDDWPSHLQTDKQFKNGRKGLLLGLYEGVPQTKRGNYGVGGVLPDKITIFKIPILMISQSKVDIEKNVRQTLIHEIAHHFGMSEDDIENALEGGEKK